MGCCQSTDTGGATTETHGNAGQSKDTTFHDVGPTTDQQQLAVAHGSRSEKVVQISTIEMSADFLDVAKDGTFLVALREVFSGVSLTFSVSFPVEVAVRVFLNGVTFMSKNTDLGDKLKKILRSKSAEIEEGMSLLRGKDLESAKIKLLSLLRKCRVVIEFIESGGQEQEGKTQHLVDRSIQELLADARSCKDSAMDAYSMAGDAPEFIDLKIQATKVAVTAAIATSLKGEVLPGVVYSDLVVCIERLVKEKVLRTDMKHFLDGSKPLFGSKRDRERRLQDLLRTFMPCECWARANNQPSLLLEMAEPNRFCVKSLLQAGLFGDDRTLEDLANGGHFSDIEMPIVAFFMEETEKLKDMPSHQDFFGAQPVSEATELYRQGCEKDAQGDSAGAKDLWEKAVETARTPAAAADAGGAAKALVRLGWESTGAGRHEEARARFAEAAALAPGLARAHFGLGYVLLGDKLGRLEDGIAAYRRALELDPEHALAHNNLGNALQAQGDLGGAVASYLRALELDPECAAAHSNLGNALKAQGDLAGAVASYRRALELDPECAAAHYNLGMALKAQKDLPGAEAAYRRALEARPDDADALCNLGDLLRERGGAARLRDAEDVLRRAVALDPGCAIKRWKLGLVLEKKGDWAGAEAQFREGMALDPADPDYARKAGEMRRKQGLEG